MDLNCEEHDHRALFFLHAAGWCLLLRPVPCFDAMLTLWVLGSASTSSEACYRLAMLLHTGRADADALNESGGGAEMGSAEDDAGGESEERRSSHTTQRTLALFHQVLSLPLLLAFVARSFSPSRSARLGGFVRRGGGVSRRREEGTRWRPTSSPPCLLPVPPYPKHMARVSSTML